MTAPLRIAAYLGAGVTGEASRKASLPLPRDRQDAQGKRRYPEAEAFPTLDGLAWISTAQG